MFLDVPLLDTAAVARVRAIVDAGDWVDGNATSGPQSALAKRNRQLPEDGQAARTAGEIVCAALGRAPLFVAAALPARVFPPLFNRYAPGDGFGTHVDNAVRQVGNTGARVRADLSATLFLSDPDDYAGGGLIAEGRGDAPIKLPAGHLLLYPATTLHRVEPVTRGVRIASFFWVQSLVRDGAARAVLFDLDRAIQTLAVERGQADEPVIRLTGVYHNLLRMWAEGV